MRCSIALRAEGSWSDRCLSALSKFRFRTGVKEWMLVEEKNHLAKLEVEEAKQQAQLQKEQRKR